MKSGTTSLWHYLRAHPRVFMSPEKEPGFFVEEIRWGLGIEWYTSLFREAGDAIAVGEATTSYTKYPRYPGVPERIAQFMPEARFIYVLRDPVDRIRSHYIHEVASGREVLPIDRAVFENPDYLNFSRYAMQLDRYLEHFSPEAFLLIRSEDLRTARFQTMARVLHFLGLDVDLDPSVLAAEFHQAPERRAPLGVDRTIRRMPGYRVAARLFPTRMKRLVRTRLLLRQTIDPARATVSADLRERLGALLADDVHRLRTYMKDPFDGWGIG
jgi:hypothetical protein